MYTCTAHTYIHKMQSHLFAMCAINQTAAGQADDFTEYRFTPRRLNSILCWNILWAPSAVSIQTCTYTVCTYFLVVLFIAVGGRYVCAVAALWMQFYMNGYKMKFRQCSCFTIKRNQTLVLLKFGYLLKVSFRKLRFVIAVVNYFLCCYQLSREISKLFFIHVLCRTSQRAHSPGNALKHTPVQYVSTGTTGWVIAVQWVSAQEAKFEQFGWVAYIYIRNNPPGTAHDD